MKIKFLFTVAFLVFFAQSSAAQKTSDKSDKARSNNQMKTNALKKSNDEWLAEQLKKIQESHLQAENYEPMRKGYIVSFVNHDYLLLAISPAARKSWLKTENDSNLSPESKKNLMPRLMLWL